VQLVRHRVRPPRRQPAPGPRDDRRSCDGPWRDRRDDRSEL